MANSSNTGYLLRLLNKTTLIVIVAWTLSPAMAQAGTVNGTMELDYNVSNVKTTLPDGTTTKSTTNTFTQQYNATFSQELFPLLFLSAGGIFENLQAHSNSGGSITDTSSTQISPNASLTWSDKMFPTNVGYQRTEQSSESNGVFAPTTILEIYNAQIGWRPLELPPWDFSYSKTNNYDESRLISNTSIDAYQLHTNFQPLPQLSVLYQGSINQDNDKLNHVENDTTLNNGRFNYADQFLDKKVSVSSSYIISLTQFTTTLTGPAGQANTFQPILAASLLFAVSNPASVVTDTMGALGPFSGGQNIIVTTLIPGNRDNFGLNFATPVPVNTLYLQLASPGSTATISTLTNNVNQIISAGGFSKWDIYTSNDNIIWTFSQTITPTVGPDPSGVPNTFGFILNLVQVSTKYVKAVVTPVLSSSLLVLNIDPNLKTNLTVTGIEAFLRQPAQSGKTNSINGQYSLTTTARLLDNPNLTYDMNFSLAHNNTTNTPSSLSYYLSNGLSVAQRFNDLFSGFARVAVNNSKTQGSPTDNEINLNASLTVTPLPTLRHSVVVSSAFGLSGSQETLSNSIFLNNTAQLYTGLAANISGGFSTGTNATGQRNDSTSLTSGLSITPNKKLIVTISYGETASKSTGGVTGISSNTNASNVSASASFTPFDTIYISAQWNLLKQSGQPSATNQNYSISWSPLRGGALQITIPYAQSLSLPDNTKTQTIGPTLRWNIRPGMTLDTSYSYSLITSPASGSEDAESWIATLRMAL